MDAAVVQQFLDFFQDFLRLCHLETWPVNDTSETEIRNAFLAAQHVEKCLDKLQKQNLLDEFLSVLNTGQDASNLMKKCFSEPSKYILKKIIISKTKTSQMDVGFRVFLELFTNAKLEKYLTELMVESVSKETLIKNIPVEFTQDKQLEFKSLLLLNELNSTECVKDTLKDLIQSSNKDTIDLLVVSLLNNDIKYDKSVKNIVSAFMDVMSNRDHTNKLFWNYLFHIDNKYLIPMCLKHGSLFKLMTRALLDCGKLLKEQMSSEYFYIDLTYSELVFSVQKLCSDDNLKLEFLDIVRENNSDLEYWESMLLE